MYQLGNGTSPSDLFMTIILRQSQIVLRQDLIGLSAIVLRTTISLFEYVLWQTVLTFIPISSKRNTNFRPTHQDTHVVRTRRRKDKLVILWSGH